MNGLNVKTPRTGGYALTTSLIFMLVLTVVAVTAMRNTTLELKMSSNAAFKTRALNASEGLRTLTTEIVDAHIFHRGWPVAINGTVPDSLFALTMPVGLTVNDLAPPLGVPDDSWFDNRVGENLLAQNTLIPDLEYRHNGGGTAEVTVSEDVDILSNLVVFYTTVSAARGSGLEMVAGYSGMGMGSARGGGYRYYELRSVGQAPASAQSVTASDYRHLIRN